VSWDYILNIDNLPSCTLVCKVAVGICFSMVLRYAKRLICVFLGLSKLASMPSGGGVAAAPAAAASEAKGTYSNCRRITAHTALNECL